MSIGISCLRSTAIPVSGRREYKFRGGKKATALARVSSPPEPGPADRRSAARIGRSCWQHSQFGCCPTNTPPPGSPVSSGGILSVTIRTIPVLYLFYTQDAVTGSYSTVTIPPASLDWCGAPAATALDSPHSRTCRTAPPPPPPRLHAFLRFCSSTPDEHLHFASPPFHFSTLLLLLLFLSLLHTHGV